MSPESPPPMPSRTSEMVFNALTRAAGFAVLTTVIGLIAVLTIQAYPVLVKAGEYQLFTSSSWVPKPPGGGTPIYGALSFIFGTVATAIIALAIAIPLGVASAAYLSEIAPAWIRKVGAFLVELLAAIPSVVFGFWGLFFIAPLIQKAFDALGAPNTGGNGLLAAGIILAIMVLPYITAIAFDVCQSVPRSQREGALALGATRWQTIYSVVLPYARPGIIAASFLALGRALGETMAVTMLVGNRAEIDWSPFALGDSIASRIANQLNEADDATFRSALIALGLVLMLVTSIFNVSARLLLSRLNRPRTAAPIPVVEEAITVTTPNDILDAPTIAPPVRSHAQFWNRLMTGVLAGCFAATVIPLFLILGFIAVRGVESLEHGIFTQRGRPALTDEQFAKYQASKRGEGDYPNDDIGRPVRRGGLGHAMLGSAVIVAFAALLAIPIGLLAAVYLAESHNSRMANLVRFLTELLGGVPSIVIGIFVAAILVYPKVSLTGGEASPLGFSGWAGAVALAIMMIPIVVRSAEESMKLVPESLRHASYALGANRMQTTLRVILPAAFPAIVTGIFLAVGRIAGETAPLILTAGNTDYWPTGPAAPTPFLPGYIYKYSLSQYDDWQAQAWAGALVLLVVVMFLNVGIRLFAGKRVVAASRAD